MCKSPSGRPEAAAPASRDHGPWSTEAVQTLTRLWREGDLSASQIAQRLGVTRNAVLGKAWRLGLSSTRPKPVRIPRPPSAPRRRPLRRLQRPTERGVGRGAVPAMALAAPVAAAAEIDPELAIGQVARLEDLPRGACHWPCGDPHEAGFAFCGRPAKDGPYCSGHAGVAYRPGGRRSVAELLRLAARAGA
jgi:GcrA cell cycle regulator